MKRIHIGNLLSGVFTSSRLQTFKVTGDLSHTGSPSSASSFTNPGNNPSSFDSPCGGSGTVAIEFDTSNGTLTLHGTLSEDRSTITGNYTVSGGSCNDTGTAVLKLTSPWNC
jgi:hypothetical protein